MRFIFLTMLLAAAYLAHSYLVVTPRYAAKSSAVLRGFAEKLSAPAADRLDEVVGRVMDRAFLYDSLMRETHLWHGMVVNHHLDLSTTARDQCDSLLFSSLRYVALKKLGVVGAAEQAWTGIEGSYDGRRWKRHPRCETETSRDMMFGLLVALSQRPARAEEHAQRLYESVAANNGYVDSGRFDVSLASPELLFSIRSIARYVGFDSDSSTLLRNGFSTAPMDALTLTRGYRSHLVALSAWLKMEIDQRRSVERHDSLIWITQRLANLDKENLFFRYLALRAAGALNAATRVLLMNDLLSMPQFPTRNLPRNCDREADYLWQRNSVEYREQSQTCTIQFSGIDFMWMAAMLVDGLGDIHPVTNL